MQRNPRTAVFAAVSFAALLGLVPALLAGNGEAERDLAIMSGGIGAHDLLEEAERLWPAHPKLVPRMSAWLAHSERLVPLLPERKDALSELRKSALPWSPVEREQDRRRILAEHPRMSERLDQLEGVALGQRNEDHAARQAAFEQSFAPLWRRRTWTFADERDQLCHDVLTRRVRDLQILVALVHQMRRRREDARSIVQRTLATPQERWAVTVAAIADVAKNPTYRGLVLTPQLGLVPIGKDPKSGLFEFAWLPSGSPPERGPDGNLVITGESALVFILIPPADTTAGAQRRWPKRAHFDRAALDRESPPQVVSLAAYFISKYEMTQGQWLRFTGRNPSVYGPSADSRFDVDLTHPVENVSWIDCRDTLVRLGLELPSEAQWEHAARAGTGVPFWTGAKIRSITGRANLSDRESQRVLKRGAGIRPADGHIVHNRVDRFRANGFGLHGTIGNVSEWCRDNDCPFSRPPRPGDGLRNAPYTGNRIFRGGNFLVSAVRARVTTREPRAEGFRAELGGVRPLLRVHP